MYISYIKYGGALKLFPSILLYFLAFISFELFLLVLPVFAITVVIATSISRGVSKKVTLISIAGSLAIPFIYLIVYLGFRFYSPSAYEGVIIGNSSLQDILSVLWQYSIGGFIFYYAFKGSYPIYYNEPFEGTKISLIPQFSFFDVIQHATLVDVCIAFVCGLIAVIAVIKCAKEITITKAALAFTSAVATAIALLSLVLYGITDKYVNWVENGDIAYLGTRYAYIAWVVAISTMVILVLRTVEKWKVARFVFVLFVFTAITTGSLASSFFNDRVASTMRIQNGKWKVVNTALSCPEFLQKEINERYFAPKLDSYVWWAKVRGSDAYWNQYAKLRYKVDTPIFVGKDKATREGVSFLDFRLGNNGELLGVFSATDEGNEQTKQLTMLTQRTIATELLFYDDGRQRSEIIAWGMDSHSCGDYMVNHVKGESIDLNSIVIYAPPTVPLNNP